MDGIAPYELPLVRSALGLGAWLCLASAVTWWLIGIDRRRRAAGLRSIPELALLWLSCLGGSPGALWALRGGRQALYPSTFRGWVRGVAAAQVILLALASLPQSAMLSLAETVAGVAMGNVSAAERRALPGKIVLDSQRGGGGGITNVVPLSSRP